MAGKAVKRESLSDQIVSKLRKDIFTGVYQPGDKLPSERELADDFATSRVTLRRAIQTLCQEGWIDTVQGRGNTVNDFRQTVSIDVLPELFFSYPEAVMTPQVLLTVIDFTGWTCEQILLSAADKATPEDEARLLELMSVQTEDVTPGEFWDNESRFYGEILRIGGNIVLQMSYNLQIKLIKRMIESGMAIEIPYPIPLYHKINRSLVKEVCAGNQEGVTALMKSYKGDLSDAFQMFSSDIIDSSSKQNE